MTQQQPDLVQGGSWQTFAGWVVSVWGWATGDMPGFTVLLTVATLSLTVLKLIEAVRRFRSNTDPAEPLGLRVRDALRTKPAALDE